MQELSPYTTLFISPMVVYLNTSSGEEKFINKFSKGQLYSAVPNNVTTDIIIRLKKNIYFFVYFNLFFLLIYFFIIMYIARHIIKTIINLNKEYNTSNLTFQ